MPLRPRQRFEVFKRDDFTCQYCGRRTPDVVLEVDHIIAIAEGGGDESENLITSCFECNRGKGAIPLDSKTAVANMQERAALIKERELQLRAYHRAQQVVRQRQDVQVERVFSHWFSVWGVKPEDCERWELPTDSSVRRFIDHLGPEEVMDAMDIAGHKFRYLNSSAVRYAMGICKWKQAGLENRVAPCTACGKRVMLEAGDDPDAGWVHAGCKEDADG